MNLSNGIGQQINFPEPVTTVRGKSPISYVDKKISLTVDQKIAQTTLSSEDEYINFYDYQEDFDRFQGDVSQPTSPKAIHTRASFRATPIPGSPASARINSAQPGKKPAISDDEYLQIYDYHEDSDPFQGDVSQRTSPKAIHTPVSFPATPVPVPQL